MADVELRGPLFDGRFDAAVSDYLDAAENEISFEGAMMVRENLDPVLQHPTGYYESHIRPDGPRVWDGGVIYGPWLEGTGERNKTTRFKGYATFRRTAQQLQNRAVDIAERVLPAYLRRMQ